MILLGVLVGGHRLVVGVLAEGGDYLADAAGIGRRPCSDLAGWAPPDSYPASQLPQCDGLAARSTALGCYH